MAQSSDGTDGRRSARTWWTAGAVAAVAVAVVVAVAVSGQGDDDVTAQPSASASATARPSATPSPSADDATAEPSPEQSTAAPGPSAPAEELSALFGGLPIAVQPVDRPAELAGGIVVDVVTVEQVTANGTGIGQFTGDGVLVTLRLVNQGTEALSLATSAVTGFEVGSVVPVSAVDSDERVSPFSGTVAAGGSTQATYVFQAPGAGGLSVAFLLGIDASVVLFEGIVPANG